MKALIIPKGETRTYESLVVDNIVVSGHLNVVNGIKAKHITGHGVITAASVNADVVAADEVEAESVVCKRFLVKRATVAEMFASDSAAVSCFLSAAYVETGKLTTAISEIGEVKADEVINLRPRTRGMLWTLLLSALLSLWLSFRASREKAKAEKTDEPAPAPMDVKEAEAALDRAADFGDGSENAMKEYIGKTVREIMEENGLQTDDLGLRRIVSCYLLLRDKGYTLHISPAEASENDASMGDHAEMLEKAA